MLTVPKTNDVFEAPRLFFTLAGEEKAIAVLEALRLLCNREEVTIFPDAAAVLARFESGLSPAAAVVIFNHPGEKKYMRMMTAMRVRDARRIPSWSCGSQWAVAILSNRNPAGCAMQIYADFVKRFSYRVRQGSFPWGAPRKNEAGPQPVGSILHGVQSVITRLNSGPDFVIAVADATRALELPAGSRISWLRVVREPIVCDATALAAVVGALCSFERACGDVAREHDEVRQYLRAGVDLPDPSLEPLYLDPPARSFSITRPDLHFTGNGVFASEIDEMPGGFVEAFHIDAVYGLNQIAWEWCFKELMREGDLLFVVSHGWSKVYVPEIRWLCDHLVEKGFRAHFVTTDDLSALTVSEDGVAYGGKKIGTIWRQFPIFETEGKLAQLVRAAHRHVVRMIPEWGHFGNKAWFSVYRQYPNLFAGKLSEREVAVLDDVLPDSRLVLPEEAEGAFPCTVAGVEISDLYRLRQLPSSDRDRIVLKICGANALASRSYGVLMGHGLKQEIWENWILARLRENQPFIIQRRVETGLLHIPVQNLKHSLPELFGARILLRPWSLHGRLISVTGTAVPADTLRVHGRVDMAVLPVKFA